MMAAPNASPDSDKVASQAHVISDSIEQTYLRNDVTVVVRPVYRREVAVRLAEVPKIVGKDGLVRDSNERVTRLPTLSNERPDHVETLATNEISARCVCQIVEGDFRHTAPDN